MMYPEATTLQLAPTKLDLLKWFFLRKTVSGGIE